MSKNVLSVTTRQAAVYNNFNIQRHLISRSMLRTFRAEATRNWRLAVAI